ncbi:MAG TPA: UDP-2,4-diacetamido-2,4,6-trideoxy-beta-L-altropyranose hydrolase [Planctomycetes bacterium]|nr:UDP-2,4-diacetamido-2,4,6-trideoxy-beta-L-altropyranose hydrolase [Planctomycetota bacterium]
MTGPGTLVIRADGGRQTGLGHLMRCLALAQAWRQAGGPVVFLSHCPVAGLGERIAAAGCRLVPIRRPHPDPDDWRQTEQALVDALAQTASQPMWLAVDGYHFDPRYLENAAGTDARLLEIDDLGWGTAPADLVLNQNLGPETVAGRSAGASPALLGPRYALLRPEFASWTKRRPSVPPVARRLLVTLGGADPGNAASLVLQALAHVAVADLQVEVLLGPANPHAQAIQRQARRTGRAVSVIPPSDDMARRMARVELAVTAAGTTCWELACLGVPAVVLETADNQRPVASLLETAGAAVCVGPASEISPRELGEAIEALCHAPSRRRALSTAAQQLVDGCGAQRVVRIMQAFDGGPAMDPPRLRPVEPGDLLCLWHLANERSVRAVSLSSQPIPLESHRQWFQRQQTARRSRLWVLDCCGLPLGVIRYESRRSGEAIVSLAVWPAFRGRGFGSMLLGATWQEACRQLGARKLVAVVRSDNVVSRRLFSRAGFVLRRSHYHRGYQWLVMEKVARIELPVALVIA